MIARKDQNIKLNQYSPSDLFPYDLGEKYSGKALGFYSHGRLVNGVYVAIDVDKETKKNVGFKSIRNDKNYYGSGLLVKMIEEVGKRYAEISNGDVFEVNDLSKKGGGYVRPHGSHQNGLDVDILLPMRGKRYNYAKVWKVLKIFDSFGFMDVIFLSRTHINSLCRYLKTSGEKNYQSLFHKLYRDDSHTSHFHVRLQCTDHNIGCDIATYQESKRGVCR
jgi:murein endopeptidase